MSFSETLDLDVSLCLFEFLVVFGTEFFSGKNNFQFLFGFADVLDILLQGSLWLIGNGEKLKVKKIRINLLF